MKAWDLMNVSNPRIPQPKHPSHPISPQHVSKTYSCPWASWRMARTRTLRVGNDLLDSNVGTQVIIHPLRHLSWRRPDSTKVDEQTQENLQLGQLQHLTASVIKIDPSLTHVCGEDVTLGTDHLSCGSTVQPGTGQASTDDDYDETDDGATARRTTTTGQGPSRRLHTKEHLLLPTSLN